MSTYSYNTTPQPNNSYTGTSNSILQQPKQSNILSGMTIPNQTQTQNSGLVSNGQNIQAPKVTQPGLISNTASSNTHTTVTNPTTGASTTKPTPNSSVLEQQKSLNQQNVNTPGYVPLVEDGLAGPKTSAALAQYGYNTQTGQKNNPTPTSTPTSTPTGSTQQQNSQVNSSTGLNANGSTTPGLYSPGNQGTSGVSQGGLIGNAVAQSQAPSQAYTDAQNNANTINQQMEDAKKQMAQQTSDINQSGTWTSRALGEQGQANIQNSATLAALGSQYQGAQQQLGAANTQQQLQQSALGTAINANQPITGVPYGTQTISPSSVGTTGGSTGQVQPNDPFYATLQSYAQMAANGQISAVPSSVTSNSVLNAQMNDMAKKINPNYNPVTSAAQSSITTQQTANVANMTAAYKSATNLGSQLNDLITTYGVNPADLNAANAAIQKVAQNVSSPQYKALNNLVTDLVATYSSILTPGSTTDTARATAASLLDASAKGSSIIETLKNLDDQAKAKIAGQTTGYGENPGTSGGSGNSASGFGWNG